MKILITTDAVGGVWNQTLELTAGLTRSGTDVLLVCIGPRPSQEKVDDARRHGAQRLMVLPHALEWMDASSEDIVRTQRALRQIIDEEAPDLVHLNGYCQDPGGHGRPVVIGAHSSLHGWWHHVKEGPAPNAWDGYAARVRDGLSRADAVVAPTRVMLDELVMHYGPIAGRGEVIHNGRAPTRFCDPDRPSPVDRPKERLVLWSGRGWDLATGLRVLDEAAGLSLPWPVVAAGPETGPDGDRVDTRHVHRVGALPEAAYRDQLASASIYVSTSLYEPFGLGPLEAAMAGAALVLPDLPSLREVWGDHARFVPPGRPDALHEALDRLMHDPSARRRLAASACEHALRTYTTARMADRYRRLYTDLVAQDPHAGSGRGRWPAAETALDSLPEEVRP